MVWGTSPHAAPGPGRENDSPLRTLEGLTAMLSRICCAIQIGPRKSVFSGVESHLEICEKLHTMKISYLPMNA